MVMEDPYITYFVQWKKTRNGAYYNLAKDAIDRGFWSEEWDAGRVANFLSSAFPNYEKKAGERYAEIEEMLER